MQTFQLFLNCDKFLMKKVSLKSTGFLINYDGVNYGVSVHHFLPINNISIEETKNNLDIITNSVWSEILIFSTNNINIEKYKIHKKIRNRIPKQEEEFIMYYDENERILMKFSNYELLPYDNINDSFNIPYIKANILDNTQKLAGLSGSPVFLNDTIIGVFSKHNIGDNTVLIIPIYVIIKNLLKKDNNHIYNFPIKPKKINAYYVKENDYIYHPTLKIDIPLNTYLLLEGDEGFCCNVETDINTSICETIINVDLNESLYINIVIRDESKYLITPRLLVLLKSIYRIDIFLNIIKQINKISDNNKLLWLVFQNKLFHVIE